MVEAHLARRFLLWVTQSCKRSGRARRGTIEESKEDGIDRELLEHRAFEAEVADIDAHGRSLQVSQADGRGKVIGVVVARYAGRYTGPLCDFSPERRALSHHFGGSLPHMRFFDVEACSRFLEPPAFVHADFGLEPPKHLFFSLTEDCLARLLAMEPADCEEGATMRTVIERWGEQGLVGGPFEQLCTAVQLPRPVSCLVCADSWADLSCDVQLRCVRTSELHHFWSSLRDGPAQPQIVVVPEAEEAEVLGEEPAARGGWVGQRGSERLVGAVGVGVAEQS